MWNYVKHRHIMFVGFVVLTAAVFVFDDLPYGGRMVAAGQVLMFIGLLFAVSMQSRDRKRKAAESPEESTTDV